MSSDSQSKLDALDAQLEALLLQRLALVEEQRVDQPAKKAAPPPSDLEVEPRRPHAALKPKKKIVVPKHMQSGGVDSSIVPLHQQTPS